MLISIFMISQLFGAEECAQPLGSVITPQAEHMTSAAPKISVSEIPAVLEGITSQNTLLIFTPEAGTTDEIKAQLTRIGAQWPVIYLTNRTGNTRGLPQTCVHALSNARLICHNVATTNPLQAEHKSLCDWLCELEPQNKLLGLQGITFISPWESNVQSIEKACRRLGLLYAGYIVPESAPPECSIQ